MLIPFFLLLVHFFLFRSPKLYNDVLFHPPAGLATRRLKEDGKNSDRKKGVKTDDVLLLHTEKFVTHVLSLELVEYFLFLSLAWQEKWVYYISFVDEYFLNFALANEMTF